MNILFVSHLMADVSAGPSWSVPASVDSLSKLDNVLWVNTTGEEMPHWKKVKAFYSMDKKTKLSLNAIPKEFGMPDIVIFEGLYDSFKEILFAKELRRNSIPYIIVPRGSLTYKAMHDYSHIKKVIAHKLFYDRYIDGAKSIQYLTKEEYEDSKYRYGKQYFILPNGFYTPIKKKEQFCQNGINALYIGRIDINHKGLDILVEACGGAAETLRRNQFKLSLYGPKTKDWFEIKKMVQSKNIEDFVSVFGPVSGVEKENALLNADLFVMTSRFEGHPMGLIEALAYGLPCLVSDGTNMADSVEEYNAGWTCKADVSSTRQALCAFIKEKDMLRQKGENALKLSQQYDWSKLAMDLHNQIERLLG